MPECKSIIESDIERRMRSNLKPTNNLRVLALVTGLSMSITAPQDAHKRIVLQVYHDLNTDFSAIHR